MILRREMIQDMVWRGGARRRPAGLLVAVAVLLLAAAINSPPAAACSCMDGPLSDYADEVVAAFDGRQTHRIEGDISSMVDGGKNVVLVFEVSRVYKGRIGPRVAVRTHLDEAACGANYPPVSRGVVVFGQNGDLIVDYCSSRAWNTTEITEVFGEGYLPDDAMELTLPQNADVTVKEFEAAPGIEDENDSSVPIPIRLAGVALGLLFFMMLVERGLVRKRE